MEMRRAESLRLRLAGNDYRTIAAKLGVSVAQAFRDVSAVLQETREQAAEDAAALRELEVARLDKMLAALDPRIEDGEPRAIETAIRLSESRRKLLGIDAPTKVETSGPNGAPLTVEAGDALLERLEQLARRAAGEAGSGDAADTARDAEPG